MTRGLHSGCDRVKKQLGPMLGAAKLVASEEGRQAGDSASLVRVPQTPRGQRTQLSGSYLFLLPDSDDDIYPT